MAFNSYAYHANRCTREAWAYLAEARDVRDQLRAGNRWLSPESLGARLESRIALARLSMRQALTYRRLRALERGRRGLK